MSQFAEGDGTSPELFSIGKGTRMALDEELAERVRRQVDEHHALSEKKMFGGLAFLLRGIHGNELIVRIDPETTESTLTKPGKRVLGITSRPMKVAIRADTDSLQADLVELASKAKAWANHVEHLS